MEGEVDVPRGETERGTSEVDTISVIGARRPSLAFRLAARVLVCVTTSSCVLVLVHGF